ncbi:MAG: ATP-binding protein [Pseudomonadota bacterium]
MNDMPKLSNPIADTVAPIANVALLSGLIERVMSRAPGLPGMGVFYGPSGFGKSTAAAFGANMHSAYVIEMRSSYTQKHLLEKIAIEVGVESTGTIARLHDRIAEQLALSARPLLIDEADFLAKKAIIEIVRDLYEASQGAVIMIGEERFPAKIEKWERVHGRVLDFVAAEPLSDDDARHLMQLYCPNLTVDAKLFEKLRRESGPSARRFTSNIYAVAEKARVLGKSSVGMAEFGDVHFWNGRAPAARRFT